MAEMRECGGCAGLGYRYQWSGGKQETCPYCNGQGRLPSEPTATCPRCGRRKAMTRDELVKYHVCDRCLDRADEMHANGGGTLA